MKQVTLHYTGQLASLIGASEESVALDESFTLLQLVRALSEKHGPSCRELLLSREGGISPTLLVILDDEQAEGDLESLTFAGVESIMLMTPISGG